MLSDDEYARIQSHLKAAKESLRLALHFAGQDKGIGPAIFSEIQNLTHLQRIIEQSQRIDHVRSNSHRQ